MSEITFYHCADIHLDTPFSTLLSKPGLSTLRRKSLFDTFSALMGKARMQNPDFIFIAGDLFEHEYSGLKTISAVNGLFKTIPETEVVMIAGNHDPEASNSPYKSYKWSSNVHFIGDDEKSVYFHDKNTEIFGLGWSPGTDADRRVDAMKTDPGRMNILLFHGDVDIDIDGSGYNTVSSGFLASKHFDYVAAGHNHKTRTYRDGLIFNPGSLEPLGFDEPGEHGYFDVRLSKGSPADVSFVKASPVEYRTEHVDITDLRSDEEVVGRIESVISETSHLYKIVLTGRKSIDYAPNVPVINGQLSDCALFVKVHDKSGVRPDTDRLKLMKGLKGTYVKIMMEKIENASEEERKTLEKALYYGIEAIENKNIELSGGDLG